MEGIYMGSDFESVGLNPTKAVMVRNLSIRCDQAQLRELFSRFGQTEKCVITDRGIPCKSFAFVEYHTVEEATLAKHYFDSEDCDAIFGRQLRVYWGSSEKHKVLKPLTVEVFCSFKSDSTKRLIYEETVATLIHSLFPSSDAPTSSPTSVHTTVKDVALKEYCMDKKGKGYSGIGIIHFPRTSHGVAMVLALIEQVCNVEIDGIHYTFKEADESFRALMRVRPDLAFDGVEVLPLLPVEDFMKISLPYADEDGIPYFNDSHSAPSRVSSESPTSTVNYPKQKTAGDRNEALANGSAAAPHKKKNQASCSPSHINNFHTLSPPQQQQQQYQQHRVAPNQNIHTEQTCTHQHTTRPTPLDMTALPYPYHHQHQQQYQPQQQMVVYYSPPGSPYYYQHHQHQQHLQQPYPMMHGNVWPQHPSVAHPNGWIPQHQTAAATTATSTSQPAPAVAAVVSEVSPMHALHAHHLGFYPVPPPPPSPLQLPWLHTPPSPVPPTFYPPPPMSPVSPTDSQQCELDYMLHQHMQQLQLYNSGTNQQNYQHPHGYQQQHFPGAMNGYKNHNHYAHSPNGLGAPVVVNPGVVSGGLKMPHVGAHLGGGWYETADNGKGDKKNKGNGKKNSSNQEQQQQQQYGKHYKSPRYKDTRNKLHVDSGASDNENSTVPSEVEATPTSTSTPAPATPPAVTPTTPVVRVNNGAQRRASGTMKKQPSQHESNNQNGQTDVAVVTDSTVQ